MTEPRTGIQRSMSAYSSCMDSVDFWRWNESRRTLPDLASYHLQRHNGPQIHTLRKSYHSPLRFLLDLSLIGVTQLPIVGPQREWPKTCRALQTSINPLLSLEILVFP